MEWTTIITIVLGSSFLGAVLTNLAGWLLKREDRSNQATYIALNLAHLFEKYAYECLSAIEDHDNADNSDGQIGKFLNKIPKFSGLPEFDYRVLDLSILDKVFDFPQQISFASESLSFAFDVLDGEDAVDEGCKSSLELAHNSLEIADSIRQKYGLTKRPLKFGDYSVRERLSEKLQKIKK